MEQEGIHLLGDEYGKIETEWEDDNLGIECGSGEVVDAVAHEHCAVDEGAEARG